MKKILLLSVLFIGCQNISDEIIVDPDVEDMYLRYNKAWSDGDFETITNEIYSLPFSNDASLAIGMVTLIPVLSAFK